MSEFKKAILYSDGGYHMERRVGSYGVHGYTFSDEIPKRGTGNPKAVPTNLGYKSSEHDGERVTVGNYIDICGGSKNNIKGNNDAELRAMYTALKEISKMDYLEEVTIYSDSKYTIQGLTKWVNKWIKNNWKQANGSEVKYKELWDECHKLYVDLKDNIKLNIEWVRGHNGNFGNEMADNLATRGRALAINGNDEPRIVISEGNGYFKIDEEGHRLLKAPRIYFTTHIDKRNEKGKPAIYHIGSHGTKDREDDLPGKPYPDNWLGVIRLNDVEPILEMYIDEAHNLDVHNVGKIMIGYQQTIFSKKLYSEISNYGLDFTIREKVKPVGLVTHDKVRLMVELAPVGRGLRLLDVIDNLTDKLEDMVAGDAYVERTSIKELLFNKVTRKKQEVLELKKDITQTTRYLDVVVKANFAKKSEDPDTEDIKVRLIVGSDIPERNVLANLAPTIEDVEVIVWREHSGCARYGTLVTLDDGTVGFFCRFEANMYFRDGTKVSKEPPEPILEKELIV